MFNSVQTFHSFIARCLLHVKIGVRLFILMGVAAVLSMLLAAAGISGLSASKESLRSVYEDRMLPLQQLSYIVQLMLNNRALLQTALSEVSVTNATGQPIAIQMDSDVAQRTATAIEDNIVLIDAQWHIYTSLSHAPSTIELTKQFGKSREAYIHNALRPAVTALRAGDYERARALRTDAQALYNKALPDLQALNLALITAASITYADGVYRFERTRSLALIALGLTTVLMTWLGLMLTKSIITPLSQVITIFRRIANGRYDSEIIVEGRDEISKVMRALGEMQTKLGESEMAIHQLAFYDPLTNLPNRRLLRDRLQQALSTSERTQLAGAVLMIDLDKFKRINDTFGHCVGDRLLVEVASRIQSHVRQADTVARLGGDEFVIVLVELSPDDALPAMQAEAVGIKILTALSQPYVLANQVHHSSASMGLCLFKGQDVGIDDLLKSADLAMYQAKAGGRNTLSFHDPQIQASLESHTALESELREAVALNQLRLYYQIQVDNQLGVLGAEVLLRWEHPVHGLLAPDRFIPIAEESGLILPIGEWVLQTACVQLQAWSANTVTERFVLSVNVSARQFSQLDFVSLVTRTLACSGVDPTKIKLELTESLVLHNVADTIDKMKALNDQGVHFSIDDFGTGYSSLAHLTQLPLQQLKIDRSFVRHIATNHNDAVIVQTIIGMAHNLGMAVIAEGVETEAQRACLERFGCPTYQGYLFGRPMPLHEFEELAMSALAV